jgi:ArsR family transcriptional regulator
MTSTSFGQVSEEALVRMAGIIKCLGHPLRLRLLEALESGELSVSDLQEGTGATQAAVSQQLAILRGRNVVDHRREGPNVYYWIIEPRVSVILDCVRDCAR